MAKLLAKDIKKKSFKVSYIVKWLELREDKDTYYGLLLVPGEKFEFFKALDFSHENNKRRFSRINPDYSIQWCEEGEIERIFYSKNSGLSR